MKTLSTGRRTSAAEHQLPWTARLRALAAVPVLALTLAACQKSPDVARSAEPPGASALGQPAPIDPVPAPIGAVGHLAESAYDQVLAGNWTTARATVDSLRVASEAIDTSGLDKAVLARLREQNAALQRSVASRSREAALEQSNALTATAASLSAPFGPRVPVEVTLLDHHGRALEIWSASGDERRLKATARDIAASWQALRSSVQSRDSAVAARFDALVGRVENARTIRDYAGLAKPVLDEVDVLEGVFTR